MIFTKTRKLWLASLFLLSDLMIGCSGIVKANIETLDPQLSLIPSATATQSPTPVPDMTNTTIVILPTCTFTPTFTPSATDTPVPTNTPIPTDTPNSTETPAMIWNPAGFINCPILLYHHVSDDDPENRYYVTLDDFRAQMEALRDWGYSTITATDLADVIVNGGELPNRPVVITFDDGYIDVYQNAFPSLHEMGFVGAIYIYVDHVGLNGFVTTEQIIALADDGWEIGNHSMSHVDLSRNHSNLIFEVQQSRSTLEEMIGVKVDTFAYPYGKNDDFVIKFVRDSGYLAGMGLGLNWEHSLDTLFDLSRIEIQGDYRISTFKDLSP